MSNSTLTVKKTPASNPRSTNKHHGVLPTIPHASDHTEEPPTVWQPPEPAKSQTPPTAIAADEYCLELWNQASEDERFLAEALCELKSRLHAVGIESYFRFADLWHRRYPKENKKNYKRGLNSVKNGAAMSPYSVSQVYCILKTIRMYDRENYTQLTEKAAVNGVTITWTHMRTIADRLAKPEHRRILRKVEDRLVRQKMTEPQLKQLIDEFLPPDTPQTAKKPENSNPAKAQIKSIISSFKKSASRYKDWLSALNQFEDEFQGDDPKEVKTVLEQVRAALEEFQRMAEFINEGRPLLETLEQQVSFLADHDTATAKFQTGQIARSVLERVENEHKQEQANSRHVNGRVRLAAEFADPDEDDGYETAPKTVLRDGDEFVAAPVVEEEEEDEDEDDDEDMDYWDDYEDFDGDDEDIFDEIDDFPDDE